jgi:spore coat polysaccharide biosynthesis protein SpsF (cytidylyltransferase family)
MIERLGAVKSVETIVVATPDAIIAEAASQYGAVGFEDRSVPEEAVADRILSAAEEGEFGVVVHVAGNQPLIDPAVVDRLVQTYRESSAHVVVGEKPEGCRITVMSKFTLGQGIKRVWELLRDPGKMASPPPSGIRTMRFRAAPTPYRFSIEMPSDLRFIRALVEHDGPGAPITTFAKTAELPEMREVVVVDESITKALAVLEA